MLPIGVAVIDVFSTRLLLPVLLWTLSRIPIFFLQFFVLGGEGVFWGCFHVLGGMRAFEYTCVWVADWYVRGCGFRWM